MRRTHRLPVLSMLWLAALGGSAAAQHSRSGSSGAGAQLSPVGGTAVVSAAVSSGYASWAPPYYGLGTPGGVLWYTPPGFFVGPGRFIPAPVPFTGPMPMRIAGPLPAVDRGPIAPPPPPGMIPKPPEKPPEVEAKPVRKDPARAAQLVTFGDRLFRGKNLKKAEERYLQAVYLDAGSAAPLLRLAQVALAREQYGEAARRLREAERVQPGWIVTAPDVQALFGEPDDFSEHLSRLESYLQVHPEDRDGWLVLGAEWYLSGRAARASDVFLRLNDPRRKPDIALSAFLQATNQR